MDFLSTWGRITVALLNLGAENCVHILLMASCGGSFFFFFLGLACGWVGGGGGGLRGIRVLLSSEGSSSLNEDIVVCIASELYNSSRKQERISKTRYRAIHTKRRAK